MEKKTYLANLKAFGNYGSIKGRIYADKVDQYWETDDKGRKYLPILVNVNKEPDQYGNTHSVTLDTWKPTPQIVEAPTAKTKAKDGLPF
jgi:hypothetical protein